MADAAEEGILVAVEAVAVDTAVAAVAEDATSAAAAADAVAEAAVDLKSPSRKAKSTTSQSKPLEQRETESAR